jgi:hypothetical protein
MLEGLVIGSKQDLDQYNALSTAIQHALQGKELRVDIILDVFASYVAASIAVHPSTRQTARAGIYAGAASRAAHIR